MTPKRPRTVTSKPSKGGCRTCRNRRVKCDQTRPTCNRCLLTGRTCDGYSPGTSPRDSAVSNRTILPANSIQPSGSLATTLKFANGVLKPSEDERNAFEFFVRETAAPLEVIFPSQGWVKLALQLGVQEPAVFHAITAVGSVSSARVQIAHHTLTELKSPSKEDFALFLYGKATSSLQRYINEALLNGASIEPVLLCCLLFIVIEVFREDRSAALSHAYHGRRAIETTSDSRHVNIPTSKSPLATKDLELIFDRLVDSTEHNQWGPNAAVHEAIGATQVPKGINSVFVSLEQAKETLGDLIAATSSWRGKLMQVAAAAHFMNVERVQSNSALQYCITHCLSRSIDLASHPWLLQQRADLLHSLNNWLRMFDTFEQEQTSRRSIIMRVQHFFSWFTLAMSRETRECSSDNFWSEFQRMLDFSDHYLRGYMDSSSLPIPVAIDNGLRPSFSLERGILTTLYLICLKCRISSIRSRALDLLRNANRREGLHWSEELSTFAESIVQLEKQRARARSAASGNDDSNSLSSFIPEEARFSDIVIEGVGFQDIRVYCSRYQHEAAGDVEVLQLRGFGDPPLHLSLLKRFVISPEGSTNGFAVLEDSNIDDLSDFP